MKLLIITQKVDKDDQLLGFFIDWLQRFSNKFETVLALCLKKGNYQLPPNIEVISLGKEKGVSKIGQLFNFYKYILIYRKKYDAVFVHMNPIWAVLGGIIWRLSNKKIFLWYTTKGVTFKLKIAEKFANKILTASKESFRIPSKKIIVTGHGIDTDIFKPNLNREIKEASILSVGRISPVKNYDVLIDAIKILSDQGIKFSVTIIGEPALKQDLSYENKLKMKIYNLGLGDYFKFLGKVKHRDLNNYYQSHNIFIHLSKTGSLDKVLLEAMASGMQIMSSNDSAKSFLPPELIFNENDHQELAQKIKNIFKNKINPDLRSYVVKNHNLNNLIDNISKIINN